MAYNNEHVSSQGNRHPAELHVRILPTTSNVKATVITQIARLEAGPLGDFAMQNA